MLRSKLRLALALAIALTSTAPALAQGYYVQRHALAAVPSAYAYGAPAYARFCGPRSAADNPYCLNFEAK